MADANPPTEQEFLEFLKHVIFFKCDKDARKRVLAKFPRGFSVKTIDRLIQKAESDNEKNENPDQKRKVGEPPPARLKAAIDSWSDTSMPDDESGNDEPVVFDRKFEDYDRERIIKYLVRNGLYNEQSEENRERIRRHHRMSVIDPGAINAVISLSARRAQLISRGKKIRPVGRPKKRRTFQWPSN